MSGPYRIVDESLQRAAEEAINEVQRRRLNAEHPEMDVRRYFHCDVDDVDWGQILKAGIRVSVKMDSIRAELVIRVYGEDGFVEKRVSQELLMTQPLVETDRAIRRADDDLVRRKGGER